MILPVLAGVVLASLLGAVLVGVQLALPSPRGPDRLAIDAYHSIARTQISGTVERIRGQSPITASCRRSSRREILLEISNGHRFVIGWTRITQIRPRRPLGHTQILAESSLAGCVLPLYRAFANRLLGGHPVFRGTTRFHGRAAFRLQVGRDRPSVFLIVSRRDLAPLGIEFRSGDVVGEGIVSVNEASR